MTATFFAEALRSEMGKRHLNQAQLAEFLEVDPAYISRWLKGASPRLAQLVAALDKLGWDLDRARPEYDPYEDALAVLGDSAKASRMTGDGTPAGKPRSREALRVAAARDRAKRTAVPVLGRLVVTADTAEIRKGRPQTAIEGIDRLLDGTAYKRTEPNILIVDCPNGSGPYPEGTVLFVRPVRQGADVPDGSTVLLSTGKQSDRLYLRRLLRITDPRSGRTERLVGAPIAPGNEYLFLRPRQTRIRYVIVGTLTVE